MEKAIKIERKKIHKMGDYHYISIPKALLDTNILSTESHYDIILKEAKNKKEKKKGEIKSEQKDN